MTLQLDDGQILFLIINAVFMDSVHHEQRIKAWYY